MALQKVMLLTQPTKLADKLRLVFTVTGGWHMTLCQSQSELMAWSREHLDLVVITQPFMDMNLNPLSDIPAILLVDNVYGLKDKVGLNIIEHIDLSICPLVSLAEKIRVSYEHHLLSEHLSSE